MPSGKRFWDGSDGCHRGGPNILIEEWLKTQSYSLKVEKEPPDWVLLATDDTGHQIFISWATKPYVGVFLNVTWKVGEEFADVWNTATAADIRRLQMRLMDIGTRLVLGTTTADLEDAAKAQVSYFALIPRDVVTYEDFFRKVNEVIGTGIVALTEMLDLHATLNERQEGITPSLDDTSDADPPPGR